MDDATEPHGGPQAWPPPVLGATAVDSSAQPWSKNAPRPDVVDRPSIDAPKPSWAAPVQTSAAPIVSVSAKRRARWPWVVGLSVLAIALLIGGIAVAAKKRTTAQPAEPGQTDSPGGVLKWDPRLVDLADFVEKSRGLKFTQPVALKLLDDEAWRVSTSRSGITMDLTMAEALGLFPRDSDIRATAAEAQDSAYSAFTEGGTTVSVHGTTLDPFTRAQVVHGLTHALDTQHNFELSPRISRGASWETRIDYVVFEGNASLVENEWIAALPPADRESAEDRLAEIDAGRNSNAPSELLVEWMLPDLLGDEFVHAVTEAGPDERNKLFTDPPHQDAALFDPSRYADAAPSTITETISGEPGQTTDVSVSGESAGAWLWFLTLASVEQPSLVRAAMAAYQSDIAAVTRVSDHLCLDAVVVPTPNGSDALAAAFETWAALDPAHRRATRRSSGSVRVNVCSTERPVNPDALRLHLDELATRNALAASIKHFQLAPNLRVAVCLAEQAVVRRGAFTVDRALNPPDQTKITALVDGLDSCPL
jgi:hypothetical protein